MITTGDIVMEWQATWTDPFTTYLTHFDALIGDARTRTTFTETVKGIVAGGSLVCQRIAAASPVLAAVQNGAQRVIRMVTGASTTRSPQLEADHLTEKLRSHAVDHLSTAATAELWLFGDGSELRKPYAHAMPHLMRVRAGGGLGQWLSHAHRHRPHTPPAWRALSPPL
jgi:hypothetical protein